MSLANYLFAYPIQFDADPTLRLRISATEETVTLATTAARETWMIDDNHPDGVDSENIGMGSILRILRDALDSHSSAGAGTFTVDLNASFRVAISASSSFELLWESGGTTLPANMFGFVDQNTASATSATGTLQPEGLWLPGSPPWDDTGDLVRPMGRTSRAFLGYSRTSYLGESRPRRRIAFHLLAASLVREEDTESNPEKAFQYFWRSAVAQGKAIRVYDDAGDLENGNYRLYNVEDASADDPISRDEQWNVLWRTSLDLVRIRGKLQAGSIVSNHLTRGASGAALTPDNDIFAIEGGSAFTLSFWFRLDSAPSSNPISVINLSSLTSYIKGVYITSDPYVRFELNDGASGNYVETDAALSNDTWYHCVCVFDGSQAASAVLKIYLDAVDSGTGTPASPPSSIGYDKFSNLEIADSSQAGIDTFENADLSHLAIWKNLAMSQAQVAEVYNSGMPPDLNALALSGKPVHWWKFDSSLSDENGGNDLTDGGSTSYGSGYPGE